MAILILNKSLCKICGEPIQEGQDAYSFPAFVTNLLDPLYYFNDDNFHESCLEKNILGEIAKSFAGKFNEIVKPTNRRCVTNNAVIANPQSHIFLGLLSSDKTNPIFVFNFTHIERDNVSKWKDRQMVLDELLKMKNSGHWKEPDGGNYLSTLIKGLS